MGQRLLDLPPTEVHAWTLILGPDAPLSPVWTHAGVLSGAEQARASRLAGAPARSQFVAARILLRNVLSRYAPVDPGEWQFATAPEGKPYVAGPPKHRDLRFNLTHTDGITAVAVARAGDVGIDAESVHRRAEAVVLARRFFAAEETRAIEALDEPRRHVRFLELWTVKEAWLKARGTGLAHHLDRFTVRIGDDGIPVLAAIDGPPADLGRWQLWLERATPHHVLGIAAARAGSAPRTLVVHRAGTADA